MSDRHDVQPHFTAWSFALAGLLQICSAATANADATARFMASESNQARLSNLAKKILINDLDREFEEKDNWGKTVRVFDGLKFEGRGLKVRVKKRKKEVNHGLWKRVRVRIDDRERDIEIGIQNSRRLSADCQAFQVYVAVRLRGFGELKHYNNGIKLFSVSGDADVIVELTLDCEMRVRLAGSRYLPDIALEPKVTGAKLHLKQFHVKRIGRMDGPLARDVGDGFRDLVRKALRKQESHVVVEANRAIQKSRQAGDLSIKPNTAVKSWLYNLTGGGK